MNPEFIKEAGISQSLTPGRNNGFLNMLNSMKQKAQQLIETAIENEHDNNNDSGDSIQSPPDDNNNDSNNKSDEDSRPIYNSMMQSLQQLEPIQIDLVDTSHQHAGHVGAKGFNKGQESHFELTIVANAFEGLNLVKRHQLVYNMLGKEMPHIHALGIKANTPSEVNM